MALREQTFVANDTGAYCQLQAEDDVWNDLKLRTVAQQVIDSAGIGVSFNGSTYKNQTTYFDFDINGLPADAVITGTSLWVYIDSVGNTGLGEVFCTDTDFGSLDGGDWRVATDYSNEVGLTRLGGFDTLDGVGWLEIDCHLHGTIRTGNGVQVILNTNVYANDGSVPPVIYQWYAGFSRPFETNKPYLVVYYNDPTPDPETFYADRSTDTNTMKQQNTNWPNMLDEVNADSLRGNTTLLCWQRGYNPGSTYWHEVPVIKIDASGAEGLTIATATLSVYVTSKSTDSDLWLLGIYDSDIGVIDTTDWVNGEDFNLENGLSYTSGFMNHPSTGWWDFDIPPEHIVTDRDNCFFISDQFWYYNSDIVKPNVNADMSIVMTAYNGANRPKLALTFAHDPESQIFLGVNF